MKGEDEALFGETERRDLELRYEEAVELRDTYQHNYGSDISEVTGDAKIFKE